MTVGKISNVILRLADLERSLEFYRDRVGMKVLGASETFAFLDGGGVTLAINAIGDNMRDHPAVTEIVFEVEDVQAAYAALVARGVEVRLAPRPVMSSGERALLAADFRDPDGHVLSITGWQPMDMSTAG